MRTSYNGVDRDTAFLLCSVPPHITFSFLFSAIYPVVGNSPHPVFGGPLSGRLSDQYIYCLWGDDLADVPAPPPPPTRLRVAPSFHDATTCSPFCRLFRFVSQYHFYQTSRTKRFYSFLGLTNNVTSDDRSQVPPIDVSPTITKIILGG